MRTSPRACAPATRRSDYHLCGAGAFHDLIPPSCLAAAPGSSVCFVRRTSVAGVGGLEPRHAVQRRAAPPTRGSQVTTVGMFLGAGVLPSDEDTIICPRGRTIAGIRRGGLQHPLPSIGKATPDEIPVRFPDLEGRADTFAACPSASIAWWHLSGWWRRSISPRLGGVCSGSGDLEHGFAFSRSCLRPCTSRPIGYDTSP
jgi:hypothetical protein